MQWRQNLQYNMALDESVRIPVTRKWTNCSTVLMHFMALACKPFPWPHRLSSHWWSRPLPCFWNKEEQRILMLVHNLRGKFWNAANLFSMIWLSVFARKSSICPHMNANVRTFVLYVQLLKNRIYWRLIIPSYVRSRWCPCKEPTR